VSSRGGRRLLPGPPPLALAPAFFSERPNSMSSWMKRRTWWKSQVEAGLGVTTVSRYVSNRVGAVVNSDNQTHGCYAETGFHLRFPLVHAVQLAEG
jgi:hypothetical protein